VITLGWIETDNINRMITITGFYIVAFCNNHQMGPNQSDVSDHSYKQLITLTVITLSRFYTVIKAMKTTNDY